MLGFTLIELIVVIAILATLTAIAMPTLGGIVQDAKRKVDLTNAESIYQATYAVINMDDSVRKSFYNDNTYNGYSRNVTDGAGNRYTVIVAQRITDRAATKDTTAGSAYSWMDNLVEYGNDPKTKGFRDAFINYWERSVGAENGGNSATDQSTGVGLKATWHGANGQRLNTYFICYKKNSPENIEIWIGQWSGTGSRNNKVAQPYYKVYPAENAHQVYY